MQIKKVVNTSPFFINYPWSSFYICFNELNPSQFEEFEEWCKGNLKGKWHFEPNEYYGWTILGLSTLYVSNDEDIIMIRMRW